MSIPRLAIIVPTRNSSSLLPRLVRSLNQQTLLDFRVIFVDASTTPQERIFLDELVRCDSRFAWVPQGNVGTGIYGAMNIGMSLLHPSEWVLFWGSDDWASSPFSLCAAISDPAVQDSDLVVCSGRYISPGPIDTFRIVRPTSFRWFLSYRLSLLLGSTPPHQCTLIGPGARMLVDQYDDRLRIASDLDYFLSLSLSKRIKVRTISVLLVDIGVGGISGIQHWRRFKEVILAYRRSFGHVFLVPLLSRYLKRLFTVFGLF